MRKKIDLNEYVENMKKQLEDGVFDEALGLHKHLFKNRHETALERDFRLTVHLSFGNGTEETRKECAALSAEELKRLGFGPLIRR